MDDKSKEFKKLETDYLGASDIVNQVGGQYVIKEIEMETALREILDEIDEKEQKFRIDSIMKSL